MRGKLREVPVVALGLNRFMIENKVPCLLLETDAGTTGVTLDKNNILSKLILTGAGVFNILPDGFSIEYSMWQPVNLKFTDSSGALHKTALVIELIDQI
jgi:hypothetical protein